jgi:hypothetical protein
MTPDDRGVAAVVKAEARGQPVAANARRQLAGRGQDSDVGGHWVTDNNPSRNPSPALVVAQIAEFECALQPS